MRVYFSTSLSLEECTQRLLNAIDPIPPLRERARSAMTTTANPSPLPAAGQRVTGFGYAPGTRPVVGTLIEHHFHIEKKAVAQSRRGGAIVRAIYTGDLIATAQGTKIVADVQFRTRGSLIAGVCIKLFGFALFITLTVPLLLFLLFSIDVYGTGPIPVSRSDMFPTFCFPILFFTFGLFFLLQGRIGSRAEAQYLTRFIEQTWAAIPIDLPATPNRMHR